MKTIAPHLLAAAVTLGCDSPSAVDRRRPGPSTAHHSPVPPRVPALARSSAPTLAAQVWLEQERRKPSTAPTLHGIVVAADSLQRRLTVLAMPTLAAPAIVEIDLGRTVPLLRATKDDPFLGELVPWAGLRIGGRVSVWAPPTFHRVGSGRYEASRVVLDGPASQSRAFTPA